MLTVPPRQRVQPLHRHTVCPGLLSNLHRCQREACLPSAGDDVAAAGPASQSAAFDDQEWATSRWLTPFAYKCAGLRCNAKSCPTCAAARALCNRPPRRSPSGARVRSMQTQTSARHGRDDWLAVAADSTEACRRTDDAQSSASLGPSDIDTEALAAEISAVADVPISASEVEVRATLPTTHTARRTISSSTTLASYSRSSDGSGRLPHRSR